MLTLLIAPPKSAVSATLSATDIDMVSLADFDSAVSLSDDTEDIAAARGKRVVPKSALSMETNDSILRWRDEHLQDTVIPIAVCSCLTASRRIRLMQALQG